MSDYNLPNSGEIFAKSEGVTAIAADKIADYTGAASFNIAVESAIAYGQNFWPQEVALVQMNVSLNYGGVYWNTDKILVPLIGTADASGTVKDSTAQTANTHKLTNSISSIPNFEYLSEVTKSSTGYKFQVWAAAGRLAADLNFSISKDEFMTTEMGIGCFADANGDVIWFIDALS
jgi:hypothetical protein